MQETQKTGVQSLGWEDPLEEEMATLSSILAWEIPWTEKPGGLYSPWGCRRVGHDLLTKENNSTLNTCNVLLFPLLLKLLKICWTRFS